MLLMGLNQGKLLVQALHLVSIYAAIQFILKQDFSDVGINKVKEELNSYFNFKTNPLP